MRSRVGDVFDDTELAAAERAACDVDVEDAFESLCPGEGRRGEVRGRCS